MYDKLRIDGTALLKCFDRPLSLFISVPKHKRRNCLIEPEMEHVLISQSYDLVGEDSRAEFAPGNSEQGSFYFLGASHAVFFTLLFSHRHNHNTSWQRSAILHGTTDRSFFQAVGDERNHAYLKDTSALEASETRGNSDGRHSPRLRQSCAIRMTI